MEGPDTEAQCLRWDVIIIIFASVILLLLIVMILLAVALLLAVAVAPATAAVAAFAVVADAAAVTVAHCLLRSSEKVLAENPTLSSRARK